MRYSGPNYAKVFSTAQFEEAIPRLDESIQTRGDGNDSRGFAFLALAHNRLGHRREAMRWLDNLVANRPQELPALEEKARKASSPFKRVYRELQLPIARDAVVQPFSA
jgi:hypothetical protein